MKVAIVHDFLTQMGGAEKVVEVLRDMYPGAPVYTSIYEPDAMPDSYREWDIRTSFLQKMVWKKKTHRMALLLYPAAFEGFDLSEYDLVISSSSAFAKGVVTQPHTTHVCYTHAPMRYVWTTKNYVKGEKVARPLRTLLTPGLGYLRTWDAVASARVDTYVANSSAVGQRIYQFYRRNCEVVYPPVETTKFAIAPPEEVGDYYVIVSRAVAYKRLDLAVDAFTRLGLPLKVVGSGRAMKAMQAKAGPSVEFLGHVSDAELPKLIARAKGFLMPGEEDFGIAAVEALACGRPVIAYKAGGSLDVQRDGQTGVLFAPQTVDALCDAIRRADEIQWDSQAIRDYAIARFDTERFKERMTQVVETALSAKRLTLGLRGQGGWDGIERRSEGWNGVNRRSGRGPRSGAPAEPAHASLAPVSPDLGGAMMASASMPSVFPAEGSAPTPVAQPVTAQPVAGLEAKESQVAMQAPTPQPEAVPEREETPKADAPKAPVVEGITLGVTWNGEEFSGHKDEKASPALAHANGYLNGHSGRNGHKGHNLNGHGPHSSHDTDEE